MTTSIPRQASGVPPQRVVESTRDTQGPTPRTRQELPFMDSARQSCPPHFPPSGFSGNPSNAAFIQSDLRILARICLRHRSCLEEGQK